MVLVSSEEAEEEEEEEKAVGVYNRQSMKWI
jgi:hypothetical protein